MHSCPRYLFQAAISGEADIFLNNYDYTTAGEDAQVRRLLALFKLEFENGFYFGWRNYKPNLAHENMHRLYDELSHRMAPDAHELYRLKALMAFHLNDYKQGDRLFSNITDAFRPFDMGVCCGSW